MNAPLIAELPMALECKVKSFNDGILIGEIVNVSADESVITDGKVDPKKLKPITFDPCNNTYVGLGDIVGNAFKDGLALSIGRITDRREHYHNSEVKAEDLMEDIIHVDG